MQHHQNTQHNQPNERPQDPRFKTAHKEAWIGVALAVFNFVWWYGFAYGLGSKPVDEYTYILGLPAWFFWSCVVGFVLMSVITVVLAKFVLTDMPLDDDPAFRPYPAPPASPSPGSPSNPPANPSPGSPSNPPTNPSPGSTHDTNPSSQKGPNS
ncbi:hypothetical protein NCCP2716_16930 [Sporosarcina sp. NCCP-2716]|uniref:YhdT family protein n=1 Tax=Sporosarcina sp. NCCP-2716 TaxID=2943679 RepID=UPI002081A8B5|nr:YhdT family protein [Sporosarcina sp. NCCP-2716]GKV69195.1 hypothetical protein NCCP2716_16930 [Sporosarcina sp. NCCP-2716]